MSVLKIRNAADTGWIEIAGAGAGDMFQSEYDPDANGIIAIAEGGTNASTASGARANLGLAIGSNVQAWDTDLDWLATNITAAGKAILDDADAAAQRSTLGLVIGTNIQAWDTDLDWVAANITGAGKALLDDADAAAQRTTLGLAIGANIQAWDTDLDWVAANITAAGKALLDDADAAAQRATLGAAALGVNSDITGLTGLNTQNAVQLLPFGASAGNTGEIRFRELAAGGSNYVGFKAPDAITSSLIWALPSVDGSADQYLKTSGAGVLSWGTPTGAGDMLKSTYDPNADGILAVAQGGTNASTAADARTNLGLAIGVNVQAYEATLQSISALGTAANKMIYTTGIDSWAETALTSFARSLVDDADAATARTTLGAAASGVNTDITGLTGLNTQNAVQLLPFGAGAGNTGEIRFRELAAGGSNYIGFKAPDAIGTNLIWVLPGADGNASQYLKTSGAGVLSWGDPPGAAFATPTMTLGTTSSEGSAGTTMRTDCRIVAFDATNPANVTLTAGTGSAALAARRDHVHALDVSISPTWTGIHTFQKNTASDMVVMNQQGTGDVQVWQDNGTEFLAVTDNKTVQYSVLNYGQLMGWQLKERVTAGNEFNAAHRVLRAYIDLDSGFGVEPSNWTQMMCFEAWTEQDGEGSTYGIYINSEITGAAPASGHVKDHSGIECDVRSKVTNAAIGCGEWKVTRQSGGYPKVRGLNIQVYKEDSEEATNFGWDASDYLNSCGLWIWSSQGAANYRSFAGLGISGRWKRGIDLTKLVADVYTDLERAIILKGGEAKHGIALDSDQHELVWSEGNALHLATDGVDSFRLQETCVAMINPTSAGTFSDLRFYYSGHSCTLRFTNATLLCQIDGGSWKQLAP